MSDMGAVPPCGMVLGELLSLAGSKPSLKTLLQKRPEEATIGESNVVQFHGFFPLLLVT